MHTPRRSRLAKCDSLPAKMSVHSDLAGNEIAWVPYRLRLSRKEEERSSEPPQTIPVDVEQQYFFVHGMKLIEKPGATTTTTQRSGISEDTVTWGDRGGGLQHTHYIRRLVDLRDELITQEETALAKAVDRLRLHSIHNKDMARYRLKLKDPEGESPRVGATGPQGTGMPKTMMTTVEKFRQMRPQRRKPIIFPLQGRQIIETSTNSNGSTPGSSREQSVKNDIPGRPRGVEDIVKANLQRLILPSSSIPNIGRKALRKHEVLELRTRALHDTRHHHRAHHKRSLRPHFMSPPFRLQIRNHDQEGGAIGDDSFTESEEESSQSSPQTPPPPPTGQLGTMTNGDQLDMEKLNQYYYVYCHPEQTSPKEEGKGFPRLPLTQRGAEAKQDGLRHRRTHSERPYNSELTHSERHYDSDKTHAKRPYSDRTGFVGMGCTKEPDMSRQSVYRRTMGMITGPDRISLPLIHPSSDSSGSPSHRKGRLESFATERDPSSSHEVVPPTGERRKRRIVIDMPHIIFNANTPMATREPTLAETSPAHADRPEASNDTLKRNDIPHKELETLPVPEL